MFKSYAINEPAPTLHYAHLARADRLRPANGIQVTISLDVILVQIPQFIRVTYIMRRDGVIVGFQTDESGGGFMFLLSGLEGI